MKEWMKQIGKAKWHKRMETMPRANKGIVKVIYLEKYIHKYHFNSLQLTHTHTHTHTVHVKQL